MFIFNENPYYLCHWPWQIIYNAIRLFTFHKSISLIVINAMSLSPCPLQCEYMDWSSPQLQESTFTPRSAIWARTMIASTPLGRCMWYASRSRSQRQYQRVQKNCRTLLLLWIWRYTDASHMVIIVEHHLKYTRLRWLSVLDMLCGLEYLTTIIC